MGARTQQANLPRASGRFAAASRPFIPKFPPTTGLPTAYLHHAVGCAIRQERVANHVGLLRHAAHAAYAAAGDAARDDGAKRRQVHAHIQGKAVVCHPAARADAERSNLGVTDPDARHAVDAARLDARNLHPCA
eukprot:366399-Chlamydomonas_euryale.AAC.32